MQTKEDMYTPITIGENSFSKIRLNEHVINPRYSDGTIGVCRTIVLKKNSDSLDMRFKTNKEFMKEVG